MGGSKGGMGGEKSAAAMVVSAAVARGLGENKVSCLRDAFGCAQVTPQTARGDCSFICRVDVGFWRSQE